MLGTIFCAAAATPLLSRTSEPIVVLSDPSSSSEPGGVHYSIDRSAILSTKEGDTLRLNIDMGSVRIIPLEKGAAPIVQYTVHIETDAKANVAKEILDRYSLSARTSLSGVEIAGALPTKNGRAIDGVQFWVHYDISVPASFSLDINTGAGDIETQDVGGTAALVTDGGNIVTGRIGISLADWKTVTAGRTARLETQGGHIQIRDVAGDVTAFTAGGHIYTGYITGEANLHTGGGHIRSAGIGGRSELATEGGNITVGKAGSFVLVKTGGGQIDFGEVRGSVRALTGGGGIRVMYVSGPMEVESTAGSICLTRVAGTVRAETGTGTITAWINPDNPSNGGSVQLAGLSQLASGTGDIDVFLPRNLAANIEAVVENGGERKIEADPALALQIRINGSNGTKAWTSLNGGGPLLKLRTAGGKIRLKFLDSGVGLHESLIREQRERIEKELPLVPVDFTGYPDVPQRPVDADAPSEWAPTWANKFELYILGGVREDADDFQKRLTYSPRPPYPEVARKSGIQGLIRLQVKMNGEGRLEVQKVIEGTEPSLVDAAISAVKSWRGRPAMMNGKGVDIISTVSFNFQLR